MQDTPMPRSFLRLAALPTFALDRLSRYEHLLWRQARQIVFTLESLRRRKHELAKECGPFLQRFFQAWEAAPAKAPLAEHLAWLRLFAQDVGITRAAEDDDRDAAEGHAQGHDEVRVDQGGRGKRQRRSGRE